MPLKILKSNALPIGVDLGSGAIKLAQLRLSGHEVELLAAGSAELPRSCRDSLPDRLHVLAASIRQIMKSERFKGRRSILSLPAKDTFLHHVKVPRLAPDQIAQTLRLELQEKLPSDVKDMVIRHVIVGEVSKDQQEVLALAVSRETLNAYLAMARKAKLDTISVNVEPLAVVDCFARMLRRAGDASRTMLFVDMGATSTQVALSHGSKIVFARNLSIGGEQFDQAIAAGMDVPIERAHALRRDLSMGGADSSTEDDLYRLLDEKLDETAAELAQCLRYYESVFKNRSVDLTVFVGGQAYDKHLCRGLAKRLNVPATIGDPLACVKRLVDAGRHAGLDNHAPHPDWAVAIGLGLGAIRMA